MAPKLSERLLAEASQRYLSEGTGQLGGNDPIAALYADRRAAYSLFSLQMSEAECEAARPYLFGRRIARKPGDEPATCLNLVDGVWRRTTELVPMKSLSDRRITLFELARSRDTDCVHAIDSAHAFWSSLAWAHEGMAYCKHVIKNFSRLLHYYYEECLDELRQRGAAGALRGWRLQLGLDRRQTRSWTASQHFGHQLVDARRFEAGARETHPRRDAQGERRNRQCARVGGILERAALARAEIPVSVMRRRRSRSSVADRKVGTLCCGRLEIASLSA